MVLGKFPKSDSIQIHAFRHNILPIVMGARPEEYARVAPHKSFLHVDQFDGPKELAEFLLELDKDDEKYNSYFQVSKHLKYDIINWSFFSGKALESSSIPDFSAEFVVYFMMRRFIKK